MYSKLAISSALALGFADGYSYGSTARDGAVAASSSSYGAPSSGYGAPSSGYGAPSSSYGAPAESYGAPAPSYQEPETYGAPAAPVYGAPAAPAYGAPAAPAYGAPAEGALDLTPIIIGILVLTGLSLLFPTYVTLTTVRRRRAADGTQGKALALIASNGMLSLFSSLARKP